jgi:Zn-dependent M28 family amino/carboxypeptidase
MHSDIPPKTLPRTTVSHDSAFLALLGELTGTELFELITQLNGAFARCLEALLINPVDYRGYHASSMLLAEIIDMRICAMAQIARIPVSTIKAAQVIRTQSRFSRHPMKVAGT